VVEAGNEDTETDEQKTKRVSDDKHRLSALWKSWPQKYRLSDVQLARLITNSHKEKVAIAGYCYDDTGRVFKEYGRLVDVKDPKTQENIWSSEIASKAISLTEAKERFRDDPQLFNKDGKPHPKAKRRNAEAQDQGGRFTAVEQDEDSS
jgi:hypothetical protein